MAVNGIELQEGQVWVCCDGTVVTLERNSQSEVYPWRGVAFSEEGEPSFTYSGTGTYYSDTSSEMDLSVLVDNGDKYSEQEIIDAFLMWDSASTEPFIQHLKNSRNPEYKEYLRLKTIFES